MKVQKNSKDKRIATNCIAKGDEAEVSSLEYKRLEDVFDYPPVDETWRISLLQLVLLIRLAQHSQKTFSKKEKRGFPATRNETWKVLVREERPNTRREMEGRRGTGNGRDGRGSGFETLLRWKASNVAAMRARFDTSRRVGVTRVKPRRVLTFQVCTAANRVGDTRAFRNGNRRLPRQ